MSFRKRIKDRLNEKLPYSPSYERFAEMAGITPKQRKRMPVYHSAKKKVLVGALVSITAIAVIGATIPAIISSNSPSNTIPFLKHRPRKLTRSMSLSEKTAEIYKVFTKVATTKFFTLNKDESESQFIYLPDLFFSCSMLASISGESVQQSYLEAIGAESIDQLKAASQELASYLIFLEKADKVGESDYGSFGLNGFFYDSSSKLTSSHDAHLQDFSNYFNAYSFSSKPTKEIIETWQKEEDENDYLSNGLINDSYDSGTISIISSSAMFDAFSYENMYYHKDLHDSQEDVAEYYLNDEEMIWAHFLHLEEKDKTVLRGSGFQVLDASINKSDIKIFLPEEGDVDELAPTIFDFVEEGRNAFPEYQVQIPMFSIKKPVVISAEEIFDCFQGEEFANSFIEGGNATCSISQNNNLTFDYEGLEGSSIKTFAKSITPNSLYTAADKPFIFSLSYEGIDFCYGKIHNLNYPV